ncbi:sialidase family protein [Adhaeretor mobilis]|uniref:Sialidase domain-containing protein n=1 Tax=Adhaeretor mobilis TaxID=1930276 RepID=A0A517MW20_9BACT|nr:sialidase family protein [Adhaeretor mobilis]QDS99082.1 hypothetical protein HG15A2_23720 [Adhaeretor mobilis]
MESTDSQVYLCHSDDDGKSWSTPTTLHDKLPAYTETCRISCMKDGEVVLLLSESERLDPRVGATNPKNLGHVPTKLSLFRSNDAGIIWDGPEIIEPPLVGPTFELCSPIVELSDGRWLLPTSTWRGWDGEEPNGMKAVAFVSEDRGRSWSRFVDVMNRVDERILFWEQKICEIDQGRLLAAAWTHVETTRSDLTNHFAVAKRDSLQFSEPEPTALCGQTPELLHLEENRVLCVYRRTDEPGLWACIVEIDSKNRWQTVYQQCLWQPALLAARKVGHSLVEEFRALKFGAPSLVRLDDQSIFLSFWCVEDCVSNIRWIRLRYDRNGSDDGDLN